MQSCRNGPEPVAAGPAEGHGGLHGSGRDARNGKQGHCGADPCSGSCRTCCNGHGAWNVRDLVCLCVRTLARNGFTQGMSRKGSCIDNGATAQVFGHLKDGSCRGRSWETFEESRADLEAYIQRWNHARRRARLEGLTPVEFRNQALQETA